MEKVLNKMKSSCAVILNINRLNVPHDKVGSEFLTVKESKFKFLGYPIKATALQEGVHLSLPSQAVLPRLI